MSQDDRVKELLFRYVEHQVSEGTTLDPAELCRDAPELLEPLRKLIRHYEEVGRTLDGPGSIPLGSRVLHYRIVEDLGAGGMGVVYKAEDTRLRRTVALKFLAPELTRSEEAKTRFLREARAASVLDHPNICVIHDVNETEDGQMYIAMAYYEGESLREKIKRGALDLDEAVDIALQLARGLEAAHQRGIVHRDIKPANVLLTEDGVVKIVDFGLVRLSSGTQVTRTGTTLGTASYMSPEQAQGQPVDRRTDLWSWGVVFYEMLTGRLPFEGESLASILYSVVHEAPPSVDSLRSEVPPPLARVVERALEKQTEARYASAGELVSDLEEYGETLRSSQGHLVSAPREHDAERTVTARATTAAAPSKSLAHSLRWRWVAALVAGLALAVVGTFAYRLVDRLPGRGDDAAPLRATFDQVTNQPGAELFPSLSPDGRWIVYTADGDGNRDIFLQGVGGQVAIDLTPTSLDDDEQPAFSPDGERIAFRSSRGGGGIFVMGRTGEGVRRVTREGFNPAWSPDGEQLVYTRLRTELKPQNMEGYGELWVVSANGGEPRRLLAGDAMLPSWSPSGAWIAFSERFSGQDGRSNIVLVPAAGGEIVSVVEDSFLNWSPVWSPGGTHLYYVSDRGGSMNIWRIAIDETSGEPRGEPEPFTAPASFTAHLSVSSDGGLLAYSSVQESQNVHRLHLDPETREVLGDPVPVTTGSRLWSSPDPSPDGKQVVFYSQVGPEGDLYVTSTDGSGPLRQLTRDDAIDRVPRWSPDGEWIAMFSDRDGSFKVWEIRPDGSELRVVTPGGVVAWSPDGRRLAVSFEIHPLVAGQANAGIVDPHASPSEQSMVLLQPSPPPAYRFVPNSWSPDGKYLTGQNSFSAPGVYIYSFERQTYEHLSEIGEWPVWFPDSRHILCVSRGREFHVLDRRAGSTTLIFSVPRGTLGPPRLSRDGEFAYFSHRLTEADIWLATPQEGRSSSRESQ